MAAAAARLAAPRRDRCHRVLAFRTRREGVSWCCTRSWPLRVPTGLPRPIEVGQAGFKQKLGRTYIRAVVYGLLRCRRGRSLFRVLFPGVLFGQCAPDPPRLSLSEPLGVSGLGLGIGCCASGVGVEWSGVLRQKSHRKKVVHAVCPDVSTRAMRCTPRHEDCPSCFATPRP